MFICFFSLFCIYLLYYSFIFSIAFRLLQDIDFAVFEIIRRIAKSFCNVDIVRYKQHGYVIVLK